MASAGSGAPDASNSSPPSFIVIVRAASRVTRSTVHGPAQCRAIPISILAAGGVHPVDQASAQGLAGLACWPAPGWRRTVASARTECQAAAADAWALRPQDPLNAAVNARSRLADFGGIFAGRLVVTRQTSPPAGRAMAVIVLQIDARSLAARFPRRADSGARAAVLLVVRQIEALLPAGGVAAGTRRLLFLAFLALLRLGASQRRQAEQRCQAERTAPCQGAEKGPAEPVNATLSLGGCSGMHGGLRLPALYSGRPALSTIDRTLGLQLRQ
jgi:hypothetical protein